MRATLNSLDDLDCDMREQNLRLLKTVEDRATTAQLETISSRSDLKQAT